MSINAADYPASVWDGQGPTRTDRESNRRPDYEDWDQLTAEVIATQTELDRFKSEMQDMVVPNGQGAALAVGSAVYMLANGNGAVKADANGTAPARNVFGIVTVGQGASGGNVTVRQRGRVTLTTAQWDTITGGSGGLVANTEYYLSGTAGAITATVPATTGDTDIVVGIAESTTVLNVAVRHILSSHA